MSGYFRVAFYLMINTSIVSGLLVIGVYIYLVSGGSRYINLKEFGASFEALYF